MSKKKENTAPEKEEENQKPEAKGKKLSREEILESQLDEKQQQFMLLAAEYDNFRKRSVKEKESVYSDCRNTVLREFLPVADNLERALAGDEGDALSYKKGVEMTFAQLMNIMEKFGVEQYGEVGDDFDPNYYNAVMHVEDENYEEQKVVEVFQKGFRQDGKILREAMVKVAN